MKKMILKHLALLWIGVSTVFFNYVYSADTVSVVFTSQSSSSLGSNNSRISVDSNLEYVNKWDNSSVVGNYFRGDYYDSVLWFFKTDWSWNEAENIRVVGSTWRCSSSYGYKLGWYAYSKTVWFIDFDFNNDTYVYYCDEDKSLHGHAYNGFTWFQSFEGIAFEIESVVEQQAETPDDDGTFVNSDTNITDQIESDLPGWNPNQNNSNFTINTIQNDTIEFDSRLESLFYIIK